MSKNLLEKLGNFFAKIGTKKTGFLGDSVNVKVKRYTSTILKIVNKFSSLQMRRLAQSILFGVKVHTVRTNDNRNLKIPKRDAWPSV